MAELGDDETSQDALVFDDELLDDAAPTRVSFVPHLPRTQRVGVGDLLVGKYRVERVHRRSSLALRLEAVHVQLGQRVAFRLLSADPRAYPEASTRFLRGARLAVQFQNERTARILDVGTLDTGEPYIVTELLSGSDLQRVLRVREALPMSEAVDYVLQACEALAEAHAHGAVHKNLKPSNLFLTRREGTRQLIVLDFGVSEDPLTDVALNLGSTRSATQSLAYLSPEQVREPGTIDARTDIWALGAMLHEMLTGSPPFEAESTPALLAMIAAEPSTPVTHLRPEIPIELEAVVSRCLAKERGERVASLSELADALLPFASEAGLEPARRVTRVLAPRRARSSLPPPLPGQPSRAIVRVTQPPPLAKPVPVAAAPRRRWGELALTAVALAAAGALGVFVAVRTMENALANALAPRNVVADLSPAQPAPVPVLSAVPIAASAKPAVPVPRAVGAAVPVRRPPAAKVTLTERAVVADANPEPKRTGLFDDAN